MWQKEYDKCNVMWKMQCEKLNVTNAMWQMQYLKCNVKVKCDKLNVTDAMWQMQCYKCNATSIQENNLKPTGHLALPVANLLIIAVIFMHIVSSIKTVFFSLLFFLNVYNLLWNALPFIPSTMPFLLTLHKKNVNSVKKPTENKISRISILTLSKERSYEE